MRVINKDRIIEAYINEPYEPGKPSVPYLPRETIENISKLWYGTLSHGWQVILVVGFSADGLKQQIIVEKKSKEECVELINSFGFVPV